MAAPSELWLFFFFFALLIIIIFFFNMYIYLWYLYICVYVYTYYLESKSSSERELCEPLTRSCARRGRLIIASMPISSFYLVFFFLFSFPIVLFTLFSVLDSFYFIFSLFFVCCLTKIETTRLDFDIDAIPSRCSIPWHDFVDTTLFRSGNSSLFFLFLHRLRLF